MLVLDDPTHYVGCRHSRFTAANCPRTNWPAPIVPTQYLAHAAVRHLKKKKNPISNRSVDIIMIYRVCQKSDTLLVSEFSTLLRCIIFAIFVYLHIIFIKCMMSEPSVVSTDGLSSRMVHHHTLRKTRQTTSKRRMFHSSSLRCGLQTALIQTPLIMLFGVLFSSKSSITDNLLLLISWNMPL